MSVYLIYVETNKGTRVTTKLTAEDDASAIQAGIKVAGARSLSDLKVFEIHHHFEHNKIRCINPLTATDSTFPADSNVVQLVPKSSPAYGVPPATRSALATPSPPSSTEKVWPACMKAYEAQRAPRLLLKTRQAG